MTLPDRLRERLDLTGTKNGCDQNQCDARTVLVDGRRAGRWVTLRLVVGGPRWAEMKVAPLAGAAPHDA